MHYFQGFVQLLLATTAVVVLATATTDDTRPLPLSLTTLFLIIVVQQRLMMTMVGSPSRGGSRRHHPRVQPQVVSLIVSMGLCELTPVRAVQMHAMVNVALAIRLVICSLVKSVSMVAATVLRLATMQQ